MAVTAFELLNQGMPDPKLRRALEVLLPLVRKVVLSPALIVLNTTAEQTFTVNGLNVGDFVYVIKPTGQAGLGIVGARVTAANTLGITFSNNTGGSITPTAAETYLVLQVQGIASQIANAIP
jgi:hypothetical protein